MSTEPTYLADLSRPWFQDRVVLVTGGGTGIGRGLAQSFAMAGARVAVLGRRLERLAETVNAIEASDGQAVAVKADVRSAAETKAAVDEVRKAFGKVDVLVNNAGMFLLRGPADYSEEEYATQMEVNVKGPWLMLKACHDALLASRGCILNIGSVAGRRPIVGESLYNASKAAVSGLTRAWAGEYAEHGVRCNAIHPGVVASEIAQAAGLAPPEDPAAMEAYLGSLHPLNRIGQPQDIAAAALFLCSSHASWITGAELYVDGGMDVAPIRVG